METIKSFTDISQSKVLAEKLPRESSDMYYKYVLPKSNIIEHNPQNGSPVEALRWYNKRYTYSDRKPLSLEEYCIPCWSLAALFDAIPQEIFDGEYIINITEGSDNRWVLTYDHYENRNHSYYGLSSGADNLVDACYEMIIKLHERKML